MFGLEKAKILTASGDVIPVMFNPNQYTVQKSNRFERKTVPQNNDPIVQYVGGSEHSLSMQLFFYTYESEKLQLGKSSPTGSSKEELQDVRQYTNKIFKLMDVDPEKKTPPICTFIWGKMEFEGYLVKAVQNFTMFLDSGIPVKATMDIEFHRLGKMKMNDNLRVTNEPTKSYPSQEGEALCQISDLATGSPKDWRGIAQANNINNPRKPLGGKKLIIPPKGGGKK